MYLPYMLILVDENRDSAKNFNPSIFMKPIAWDNLCILYVTVVNIKTVLWGQTAGSSVLFQRIRFDSRHYMVAHNCV